MWLPTPIYERVPQFWLLLGLLFMSSGTYLGFDYSLSFVYFGVGFICVLWSLWIFSVRLRSRQAERAEQKRERQQQQAARDEQNAKEAVQGTETAA